MIKSSIEVVFILSTKTKTDNATPVHNTLGRTMCTDVQWILYNLSNHNIAKSIFIYLYRFQTSSSGISLYPSHHKCHRVSSVNENAMTMAMTRHLLTKCISKLGQPYEYIPKHKWQQYNNGTVVQKYHTNLTMAQKRKLLCPTFVQTAGSFCTWQPGTRRKVQGEVDYKLRNYKAA